MMKNLLVLLMTICATVTLSAQVSVSPSPVIVEGITAADADVPAYSDMTNEASETRTYRWVRTNLSISDGWESAVCDKNLCWFPNVDTKEVTFEAGEENTMDVHIYPNGVEGSAIVQIVITDVADTTINVTNLYYFNASPSSTNEVEVEKISMFPNPTDGEFSIKAGNAVKKVVVYNLTGRAVREFETAGKRSFDVSDLPRGNYLVRMLGKDGSSLVTRLLQKL
jgi:outer membrane lipoprotein-sorting protein